MAVKTYVRENSAMRGALAAALILATPAVFWLQGRSFETILYGLLGSALIVGIAPDAITRLKPHPLWQRLAIWLLIIATLIYIETVY